jgi:hypothetical protein
MARKVKASTLDRKEGQMDQHLDELKRACKAAAKRSDSQRIDQGESTWFFGRPAPGPPPAKWSDLNYVF